MTDDERFMKEALRAAGEAYDIGEVPIGAVVVKDGEIVGIGFNRRETGKNARSLQKARRLAAVAVRAVCYP